MPGPMVHLIVLHRLSATLRDSGGRQNVAYADLLDEDPCSPYSNFGSVGPDFLFFSLREYGNVVSDVTNTIFAIYDAFEPLIDFYEQTVEPAISDLEDALVAADQAAFGGFFKAIGDTGGIAAATALSAVAKLVSDNVDLFYPFYPKVQKAEGQLDEEKGWYWFDFLHYRRTGDFASRLWSLAGNDRDLQRYVLGYTSHIATDVVGHPFVNAVTGGPFRTHWHRHKLVENWIDAYARRRYSDAHGIKACLDLTGRDTYVPDAIAGSYYSRLTRFERAKMPRKLSTMLETALTDVYGGSDHPPFLNAADFDTTYRFWHKWFEYVTSIGAAQPPAPVPPPGAAAAQLINDFASGIPGPPFPSGNPGGGFNVLGLFAAMLALTQWLIDSLAYMIDWIVQHAGEILSLPYTEAVATANWLVYQVQKAIWEIYDNLRFALVLAGYTFPEPRDLDKSPWGDAFVNTAFAHLTGGPHVRFDRYPLKQEAHGLTGPTEHHLPYPSTPPEERRTEAAPQPFYEEYPEAFIDRSYEYSGYIENLYRCTDAYGPTDSFTNHVNSNSWSTGQFGSAIDFSARLIGSSLAHLPNFNLDGDRGYGWKTWRAREPEEMETNPVEVSYIDP